MKGFHHKLCTVGSFVFGVATIKVLFDGSISKPIRKQMIRGAKGEAFELPNRSLMMRKVLSSAAASSEDPVLAGGNGTSDEMELPGEDPEYLEWAYDEFSVPLESSVPSTGAQPVGEQRVPTSSSVGVRASLLSSGDDDTGFRMKLYSRDGNYRQQITKGAYWCMSCGSDGCKKNQVMVVANCKTEGGADTRFKLIQKKRGRQYQVVGTDFCLEKIGSSRRIAVKTCRTDYGLQLFKEGRQLRFEAQGTNESVSREPSPP